MTIETENPASTNEPEFDIEAAAAELGESLGFKSDILEVAAEAAEGDAPVDKGTSAVDVNKGKPAAPQSEVSQTDGTKPAGSTEPSSPADSSSAAPKDEAALAAEVQAQQAGSARNKPNTWKKEALAEWDKIPAVAQAEILRREEAIHQGLAADREVKAVGETFHRAIGDFMPVLTQHGINPFAHARQLFSMHNALALGTADQKRAVAQEILRIAGMSQDEIATLQPAAAPNPEVVRLQRQLDTVQSQLTTTTEQQQAQRLEQAGVELAKFQADPANVHFNDVQADIADILGKKLATNLKDAYDMAVLRNPVTRAKEQQRLVDAAKAETERQRLDKLNAAKKLAGANVQSRAKNASQTAPVGSIDDTLTARFQEKWANQ